MEEELISVIVPVYNVEKYLNKCVESIINQSYKNLQIILIDDGSKDKSGKICDEYAKKDKRIEVTHKENAGVSAARNTGVEKAKGEWITFVDADDWIEKGLCSILYIKARQNDCEIAMCGYSRVVGSSSEVINFKEKETILNSKEYLIAALNPQTGVGFCHTKLIKKTVINEIRFQEKLKVGEDAIYNEMIAKNITKAIYVKEPLYNYRINMNSVVKRFDENYVKKYLISMESNKKYIFEVYSNQEDIIQNYYNYVAFHVMLIAVNYCYNPENKKRNKENSLKEVCKNSIFKEGLEQCNYDNLSLTRKITLFTLKHKLYLITGLICKVRQMQNRRK